MNNEVATTCRVEVGQRWGRLNKVCFIYSKSIFLLAGCFVMVLTISAQQQQRPRRATPAENTAASAAPVAATNALIVRTQPNAAVWLDGLRRGTTDASGQLAITNIPAGRRALRVRARGFSERVMPLLPAQRRGIVRVPLTPTTNKAELLFQEAEEAREKAGDNEALARAAAAYRKALELRPVFPEAHVGLARVLLDMQDHDAALEEIAEARKDRAAYAEASAVEGRILHSMSDNEAAIRSYRRAIREGRGRQPEAYTGMGIALNDQGQYEEAAKAFSQAVAQLADTEPVVYQLLGAAHERLNRYKEAAEAYEKYLQLAPNGKLAPAIRSIMEQLKQQAAQQ